MDLLIKGGTVVTAQSSFKADVAVKNGKITGIGANLRPEKNTEVVDAKGKLVLPGAIDGHTHLAMPFGGTISTDDYYAGTRSAACGGTTTVFDFVLQGQGEPMLCLLYTSSQKFSFFVYYLIKISSWLILLCFSTGCDNGIRYL